jgi:hypothetical protein
MVFLGGEEGGRENARSRSVGSFFTGRHVFSNRPIFFVILHIDQWGFHYIILQTIGNSVPDLRCPGETRTPLKFRQPEDLFLFTCCP